jgi:hypothetical protein
MVTDDLLSYIQTQLKKNTAPDLIGSRLVQAGWHVLDVEQGFDTVRALLLKEEEKKINARVSETQSQVSAQPIVEERNQPIDPYREIPQTASSRDRVEPMRTPPLQNFQAKMWAPKQAAPQVNAPIEIQQNVEPQRIEMPVVQQPQTQQIETKIEAPEMSVTQAAIVQAPVSEATSSSMMVEISGIKEQSQPQAITPITPPVVATPAQTPITPSLPKVLPPQEAPVTTVVEAQKPHLRPITSLLTDQRPLNSSVQSPIKPTDQELMDRRAALRPELKRPAFVQRTTPVETPASTPVVTAPVQEEAPSISKQAMIYSYAADLSLASKEEVEVSEQKSSKKNKKWIFILLAILIVGGGIFFAFAKGLIKLPSVVRKDPTNVIFSAAIQFNALKSYKTETTATVIVPSIATITTGLVSGQAVRSNDMENITITASGRVNNKDGTTPMVVDYDATAKSTLLQNQITSNVKYDGSNIYAAVPALDQLLGMYAPQSATVQVPNGQLADIVPELSQNLQDLVHRVDVHDVLSKGVPATSREQIKNALAEFMQNISVTQKTDEDIKGIPSYQYEITADHQTIKNFLLKIVNQFTGTLSDEQKKNLDEGLGSITLESLQIWVGKSDGAIHQYQFNVIAPLSKVLALNDSGIAGKQVEFSWKRTYYDFDVPNNIQIPTTVIPLHAYIQTIRDAKIKNIVSSFSPTAKSLSNAEGTFGKANPKGSCLEPTNGSLFSPIGHSAGAIAQISSISTTMQKILGLTNNVGACYSTPSTWAMAFPLASNPQSYYCADSTGALTTLPSELTGPVCK